MTRTAPPLRDRELVAMLADEPELLAIADALVETQQNHRPRSAKGRRLRPVLAAAVVTAALAVAGMGIAAGFGAFHSNLPVTTVPSPVLVAKVSIPKGTSGAAIGSKIVYSTKKVPRVEGSLLDPAEVRGEIAIRTIPAGAQLTTADFALRGPLYYPRGYPKRVPASQVPAKMSRYLPAQSFPFDLEVAPGVWADGSPSEADLDKHVANGTLIGYCRAVQAFQAHNPRIPFATRCWRK